MLRKRQNWSILHVYRFSPDPTFGTCLSGLPWPMVWIIPGGGSWAKAWHCYALTFASTIRCVVIKGSVAHWALRQDWKQHLRYHQPRRLYCICTDMYGYVRVWKLEWTWNAAPEMLHVGFQPTIWSIWGWDQGILPIFRSSKHGPWPKRFSSIINWSVTAWSVKRLPKVRSDDHHQNGAARHIETQK